MREILFKAKAINRDKGYHRTNYKNGDWVYGLITRLYDEQFENLPAEMTDENGVSRIEVDHNTICQYTEFIDKNDTKIFEGDIVNASWGYKGLVDLDSLIYASMECRISDDIEVIGNIFDNHELLKGGLTDE